MNIGQVAKASNLPAKTIRYYEGIGLISPARLENGYRHFDETQLHKLRFLQRARGLGFTVEDCRTLLSLYEDKTTPSSEVKAIAQSHLARIEENLGQLLAIQSTLSHLIDECAGDHRPDCPILADLAKAPAEGH